MHIKENLIQIKKDVSEKITLVAVSKTKPIKDIQSAYDAGQRAFGENKIQEMVAKYNELPKDIEWHMIGHLQRNKIKYMASFVHLIHGVDSFKTLLEINKQAKKNNRIINCLLQVKIAQEDSKFGFSFDEVTTLLQSKELQQLEFIKIKGLMGMASFTDNQKQIEEEFKSLSTLFTNLKTLINSLDILSMGMSGDYSIAIKNGSSMIRVGSAIFGKRNYLSN